MKHLKYFENNNVDPFGEEDWDEDEIKTYKYNESGKCPACGSTNLDWYDTDYGGDSIEYKFSCENCNFEGMEVARITFVTMADSDGEDIVIGQPVRYDI